MGTKAASPITGWRFSYLFVVQRDQHTDSAPFCSILRFVEEAQVGSLHQQQGTSVCGSCPQMVIAAAHTGTFLTLIVPFTLLLVTSFALWDSGNLLRSRMKKIMLQGFKTSQSHWYITQQWDQMEWMIKLPSCFVVRVVFWVLECVCVCVFSGKEWRLENWRTDCVEHVFLAGSSFTNGL